MLLPELLKTFEAHDDKNGLNFDIIRRGTSVMFLKHKSVIFMDGANFAPGVSLEQAGQTFGATVHKTAFPYEYWTCLDSMKNTTEWPVYSAFKSTLRPYVIENPAEKLKNALAKGNDYGHTASQLIEIFNLQECCSDICVTDENKCPEFTLVDDSSFTLDPELYLDSMKLFYDLKVQGEIFSMHDYLLYYNIRSGFKNMNSEFRLKAFEIDFEPKFRDCIVGLQTFENMNYLFDEQFGISLLNNFSIPSVSLKILWQYYDTSQNSPYSFGPNFPELPQQIRSRCYGGISGPIQSRHVEANGDTEKYPDYVTRTPNGDLVILITAEDVTSLYG